MRRRKEGKEHRPDLTAPVTSVRKGIQALGTGPKLGGTQNFGGFGGRRGLGHLPISTKGSEFGSPGSMRRQVRIQGNVV